MKRARQHQYKNPVPSTAIIFENEKEEILLVKRAHPPKKGWWDLPGGFVEYNESFEEGAIREVKEELDVSVSRLRYITSDYNLYLYKGKNYHVLCVTFAAEFPKQTMVPQDDVSSIRFFPKNAIPFNRIAFRSLITGLKKYLSSFHQPDESV